MLYVMKCFAEFWPITKYGIYKPQQWGSKADPLLARTCDSSILNKNSVVKTKVPGKKTFMST